MTPNETHLTRLMDANESRVPAASPPRYKETTFLEDIVPRWLHPPHARCSSPGSVIQCPQLLPLKIGERHRGFFPLPRLGGYWVIFFHHRASGVEDPRTARCPQRRWRTLGHLQLAQPTPSFPAPSASPPLRDDQCLSSACCAVVVGLCFDSFILLCNMV